jgi:predicted metal-binding protein
MNDRGPNPRPVVMVCITCHVATAPSESSPSDAPRAGSRLADATLVAAADSPVSVQRIRCLGNCNRGLSAAIRAQHTWSYVFGGLDLAADGPSLIIGAQLLAQSADGLMPWRERPECLKRGLIARIPPQDFSGDLS